jgi:quinol monooxygenase YgiN
MTNNIRNIVNLTSKIDNIELIKTALIELAEETKNEPGCISFKFYQYQHDTLKIILIEDFLNHDAMQKHLKNKHTQDFFKKDIVNVDSIDAINTVI